MVESIYFLKPAWCGTHFAGLWPEQGLQPVTRATALRRWFVTFVPAIFLFLGSPRRRTEFFAATAGALSIAWSPFIFQDPRYILGRILAYRSLFGHWGLSWLTAHLAGTAPGLAWINSHYQRFGTAFIFTAVVLAAWWLNRSGRKPRLFSQIGFTAFLFVAITNGFGVQYLAWIAPWVVELGALPTFVLYAASGAFLFVVYNFWSYGPPWNMADSNTAGDYQGRLDYFQLLCWLAVLFVLWTAWKKLRGTGETRQPFGAFARPVVVGLSTLLVLGFGFALDRDSIPLHNTGGNARDIQSVRAQSYAELADYLARTGRPREAAIVADEAPQASPGPEDYLSLSLRSYQAGDFPQSIAAAREALKLRPDYAEAWNNMAAAFAALHRWDDAIDAAGRAIRLKPDYQLARNNLAWAQQGKAAAGRQ